MVILAIVIAVMILAVYYFISQASTGNCKHDNSNDIKIEKNFNGAIKK